MSMDRFRELIDRHRGWKSECWNPINPHVRTCQNGDKPCELCASVMQAHEDFANELEALVRSPREEERPWPREAYENVLRRSALNLTDSQICGIAILTGEVYEKWASLAAALSPLREDPERTDRDVDA